MPGRPWAVVQCRSSSSARLDDTSTHGQNSCPDDIIILIADFSCDSHTRSRIRRSSNNGKLIAEKKIDIKADHQCFQPLYCEPIASLLLSSPEVDRLLNSRVYKNV